MRATSRSTRPLRVVSIAILGILSLLAACAPAPSPATGNPATVGPQSSSQPARTLVVAVRNEPATLAALPLGSQGLGIALYFTKRIFNADLAILNGDGVPQPYLVDALPQLDTDSWVVNADGTMQTAYHLKPNITWHDGTSLTSDAFVFAWQVYSTPAFGASGSAPFNVINDVTAPDPSTIVITWKKPYADADSLQSLGTGAKGLPPLPRALLESAFQGDSPEVLANSSFWTQNYVGLGPYRLDQWQPGSSIDASAFAQHVLGAPKIQRIHVVFIGDGNAALAQMLSGNVQLAGDVALPLGYVPDVLNGWGPGHGTAILHPNQYRGDVFQLRPEIVGTQALLDPRVRKALAYAVDKDSINAAAWSSQSLIADIWIAPTSAEGRTVDAAITKYPFDLGQSQQLMTAAGYTRGSDGVWTSPSAGRVAFELSTNTSPNNEAEMSSTAAGWRQAGFDASESVLPTALGQDNQARSTFTGLFDASTNVGEQAAIPFTSANIGRADNRWVGANRGGYSSPSYDQLIAALDVTLDRIQRAQTLAQAAKVFSDDEPAISLLMVPQPWVFVNDLRGPKLVDSNTNMSWNIEQWELS